MMTYDVVVIGGGPAGVQAAISARSSYPEKSIAIIRKENRALIPCGIPYIVHSLGSIDDDILPDALLKNANADIILSEVVGIDNKTLELKDGQRIEFDQLVIATGSTTIKPPIPGIDNEKIYILSKDYESLKEMREALKPAKRVVIVGGGYVGVEFADELVKNGIKVNLIEKLPSLLPTSIDPEFSRVIEKELTDQGVEVTTGTGVAGFSEDADEVVVNLENGTTLQADYVIVSVGFKPNTRLAEQFGLEVNEKFGIVVDEYMKTSDNDIFAVGDCAAKRSCFTGDYRQIMLASTAMSQGRLAGSNLFSLNIVKTFPGTLGSFATKIGKVAIGVTGITESRARKMNLEYVSGNAETMDRHPGKLPGVSKMKVKLVFSKYTHVLLGAQVLGGDSVGECINMLSVMIQKKMTDMEIDTLQIGTHPLLTPSPLGYGVINATVNAIAKWYYK